MSFIIYFDRVDEFSISADYFTLHTSTFETTGAAEESERRLNGVFTALSLVDFENCIEHLKVGQSWRGVFATLVAEAQIFLLLRPTWRDMFERYLFIINE